MKLLLRHFWMKGEAILKQPWFNYFHSKHRLQKLSSAYTLTAKKQNVVLITLALSEETYSQIRPEILSGEIKKFHSFCN